MAFPGLAGIAANERIVARIEQDLERLMADFAKWEQVKVIRVLSEPFTIDGGELTPTLKLKRKPILAKYGDVVEGIYS